MTTPSSSLIRLSARALQQRLAAGEVSPLELVEAAAARIAEVDPQLNALPTLCLDRARDHARRLMRGAGDDNPASLRGIPLAVKDLHPVAGVRTTFGSRIHRDYVPRSSDPLVRRLEDNGGIVIGKSNTPEFGAGASTINEVFGATRNPWHTALSVAGSSGGSCAAVAAGACWLATGSDLGGSLRTPAAFNGVVGLRPSPGLVVRNRGRARFSTLWVNGPIARNVVDAALLLDAMCGADPAADPAAAPPPPSPSFVSAAEHPRAPRRVAFSPDLGVTPVDPGIAQVCEAAALRLGDCGTAVERDHPDLEGAPDCFGTLRAAWFAAEMGATLRAHRDLLKPDIVWNIEKGQALSATAVAAAERLREQLTARMTAFFRDYDALLCPAAIVPPFPVMMLHPETVGGVRFENYVQWLNITSVITLTGCPAISVPAGLTTATATTPPLPVGLQIVCPPHCESRALQIAALIEQQAGICQRLPLDPVGAADVDQLNPKN